MKRLYGVLGEFADADRLLSAVAAARQAGHEVDAYSPFPVPKLDETLGFRRNAMPMLTFVGGLVGGIGGYFMQWYAAVIDYPVNIGGRPLNSWPAFMPVTLALAILGASFAAVFGMLIANGLPRLHHPLFEIPEFEHATRNRFFVCLRAATSDFDAGRATAMLRELNALKVWEVPA